MSNFRLVLPYIYVLESPDESDIYEGFEFPGWYFSDEVDQMHGPFSTFEECKEIFDNYIEQL